LNRNISDKDKKDWEKFLSKKEKLDNKDQAVELKKFGQTRSIDLHGYSLIEANENIKKFILKSFAEGVEKITVITGKGIHSQNEKNPFISKKLGILKHSVPEFINTDEELSRLIKDLSPAKIQDGGDGAFYIYLRKKK
tara:strand:+ start:543 stop:956 length:414 start_codon:yes stop_codon:yes gene_type:complete